MKKALSLITAALLAIALLAFAAACGSEEATTSPASPATSAPGSPTTSAGGGESATSESTPPDSEAPAGPANSPVFAPQDLLSAAEASEITGFAVSMDEGALFEDPESGTISERYAYDLNGTGIHALVEIHQDSFKPAEAIQAGETAQSAFEFEQELSKDEITPVDLGEDAFSFTNTGQLHMYYQGYYIVVAFDADEYDSSLNAPLNVKLGEKILANLQTALQ